MKDKFKKIEESLDIVDADVTDIEAMSSPEVLDQVKKLPPQKPIDGDYDKDYEYTRGNLYSLIQKGQEAINQIMDLAQQSDSPRAYEVAGQLIKNVGDVTDKLIDLQNKMKKLKEEDIKGPKNVTNALFVGSTADLQKLLKNGMLDSK